MTKISTSRKLLWSITGFFVSFLLWAGLTEIDEVTRSQGRVVPSSQLQVVQNLEGGIVAEILVRPGDRVKVGDILIRLDRTRFRSELSSNQQQYASLVARAARLTAESDNASLVYPAGFEEVSPDTAQAEQVLYDARMQEHRDLLALLGSRLTQRRQERTEAEATAASAARTAALASEEVAILAPLVEREIEPRLELIRAQQREEGAKSEGSQARALAKRLKEAVIETEREISATSSQFRARALGELGEVRAELASLGEAMPAIEDRVTRTEVKSPIDGIVNQVHVATVGGIVQPGMPIVEIVPEDDTLLIEAHVRPEDIAFLYPGQEARVKLTAYDFAVFGALVGHVETIGADAVRIDDDGTMAYLVRIRTEEASLERDGESLPILPGMVAEVDILSGKKSILTYLLTPVTRIKNRAFRER